MGKKAKEHRKKISQRNEQIKLQEKKIKKAQQEFLMQMIEREKQAGQFNSPVMPLPGGPLTEGPLVNIPGPSLGVPSGPQI
jgi:hypothetical protein